MNTVYLTRWVKCMRVTFPFVEIRTLDQTFDIWMGISWMNCLAETLGGYKRKTSPISAILGMLGMVPVRKSWFMSRFRCGRNANIQNAFSPDFKLFRPKSWFCIYEGKFSPLEGMVTLIIYLIINLYYLGYLLIFTGVNQGSVNWHRWSFIHCL